MTDMEDEVMDDKTRALVASLRARISDQYFDIAADAIEAQAAEIERLRAALRELLDDCVEYCRINNLHNNDGGPATNHAMRMAREALGGAKDE